MPIFLSCFSSRSPNEVSNDGFLVRTFFLVLFQLLGARNYKSKSLLTVFCPCSPEGPTLTVNPQVQGFVRNITGAEGLSYFPLENRQDDQESTRFRPMYGANPPLTEKYVLGEVRLKMTSP